LLIDMAMGTPMLRVVLLATISATILAAQITGVIRPGPLVSPQDVANLEARVLENPDDLDAEGKLLQFYARPAGPSGYRDPGIEGVRLGHIVYLVQHHPEAPVSASRAAYVARAIGRYANAVDHEAVRGAWMDALAAHPKDDAVILNAVRFLAVEDSKDAEDVLNRAVEADRENRELAANLGFLYAREIKGSDLILRGPSPADAGRELPLHATAELEQSSNPVVLAAAGTALANLAKGSDFVDGTMMDQGEKLLARARDLAPDDADLQGPMPLIKYFAAAQKANDR
jgi:hypothetical protein